MNTKNTEINIPERQDIAAEDTWNLSALFTDDAAWEKALAKLESGIPKVSEFKGRLGESAEVLAEALDYSIMELGLLEERLGYYVMLRQSENVGDSTVQALYGRYMNIATKLAAAGSWMDPEIQSIDDGVMEDFLKNDLLSPYRIYLSKLLRFKPHILSEKEESLLAKQMESTQVPSKTFSALTNVDMDFGKVKTAEGELTLTQSSYASLLL
ncbi:MAG: oligoendopeptidase F, partial [Bacteroidetes bacterium]